MEGATNAIYAAIILSNRIVDCLLTTQAAIAATKEPELRGTLVETFGGGQWLVQGQFPPGVVQEPISELCGRVQ